MSREKQIEEMAKIACDATEPEMVRCCKECIFDKMCDIQDSCKALYDAGYRKQEWISVDERLPERWKMVLVFCSDVISIDFISSMGVWFEHINRDSVTHWMPLPEAPKMKGGVE